LKQTYTTNTEHHNTACH